MARARAFQARCRGFESRFPLQGTEKVKFSYKADVAQSVERVLGKDEVTSSILVIGSSFSSISVHRKGWDATRSNNSGVRSLQSAQLYDY